MKFAGWKWLVSVSLVVAVPAAEGLAARPADTLLPAKTVALLSFPTPKRFVQAVAGGKAGSSDSMLSFLDEMLGGSGDDFRNQIGDRLGLDWDATARLASGTLTLAVVSPEPTHPAIVLICDVSAGKAKAQAELDARRKHLVGLGLQLAEQTLQGERVRVYQPSASEQSPSGRTMVHALHDGMLLAAESIAAMQTVLSGWQRQPGKQLASASAYRAVIERSRPLLGSRELQASFYIVPVAWAQAAPALRLSKDEDNPSKASDADQLRRHGFAAVQAIGGSISVPDADYESLFAAAVHAPLPYQNAMRMLDFPGTAARGAEPWVPSNIGSLVTLSWNLKDAWKYYGPLYDDTSGDGVQDAFNDMLDGLRDDPEGPQIDARKDFFPKLTDQVTIVTGRRAKDQDDEPGRLYAVAATEDLAPLVRRYWEGDPDVRKRQWGGTEAWEVITPPDETSSDNPMNLIRAAAFRGKMLLLATDPQLLRSALEPRDQGDRLAAAADFNDAQKRLDGLTGGAPFLRCFSRSDSGPTDLERLFDWLLGDSHERTSTPMAVTSGGVRAARMDRAENGWTLMGFTRRAPSR